MNLITGESQLEKPDEDDEDEDEEQQEVDNGVGGNERTTEEDSDSQFKNGERDSARGKQARYEMKK